MKHQNHRKKHELQENSRSKRFNRLSERMFMIKADTASNDEIRTRLLSGGRVTGTNMVVMVCAILIASVGLNTNSIPVIIGAMLISPLMGSILAIANLNLRMLGGAAYLFLINAYFIYAAACVFLSLLEIPKVRELTPAEWHRGRMKMVRNTIIVLLPCIVLAFSVGLR